MVHPLDGPAFGGATRRADAQLRPGRRGRPAQPDRQPRRAAGADGPGRRPDGDPPRDAPPADPARRAVHLLRRRDRDRGRRRPGLPTGVSRSIRRPATASCAASSARVIAARREHVALRRGTVRILGSAGGALAYLREADGRVAARGRERRRDPGGVRRRAARPDRDAVAARSRAAGRDLAGTAASRSRRRGRSSSSTAEPGRGQASPAPRSRTDRRERFSRPR